VIAIRRLDEPDVLARNKAQWTADYLAERAKDPKKRPRSNRYAHAEVVSALETMSHHKCFYCEQSTKQTEAEVDHHRGVVDKPELAFEWENLCLSCSACNKAKNALKAISVTDCLDPCDPEVRPADHLAFDKEIIRSRDGSTTGRNTIMKYRLDREELDYKRIKALKRFDDALISILQSENREGRESMTADEEETLRSFGQSEHPFSLMFSFSLRQMGL
jgi:uncharacterized protein (TIGR02646 family)